METKLRYMTDPSLAQYAICSQVFFQITYDYSILAKSLPSSSWKTDHQIIFSASVYIIVLKLRYAKSLILIRTHVCFLRLVCHYFRHIADFTATRQSYSWDYMRVPCEDVIVGLRSSLLHRVVIYCSGVQSVLLRCLPLQ